MASRKSAVIIAYNGIDGACAAAMVLLAYPKAELVISSARAIAWTLGKIVESRKSASDVHICGLGMACNYDELCQYARALAERGSKIIWYCGRRYLDATRPQLEPFSTSVFLDVGSNTKAVCRHLGLDAHFQAPFLLDLARIDPQISDDAHRLDDMQQFWADLVSASYAEFAKYQDRDRYLMTIRALASGRATEADRQLVAAYRQFGFRYALEGPSKSLKKLRDLIRKCAAAEGHVLVLGESGVGKEHVAHLIHERGQRAAELFLAINCAQFSGNVGLANSTLFGHRKGAFTGATENRQGAFQAASGGVLFLDELAELPLEAQGKLLRVLEDGKAQGEGMDHAVGVDTRVIAATNADLPAMVRGGTFRADLFYRLAVLRIPVPPLRERPEDIDALVTSTLDSLAAKGRNCSLSRDDRCLLRSYDWPGNVRQLVNVLRRAVQLDLPISEVLEEERALGSLHAPLETESHAGLLPQKIEAIRPIDEVQREYARRALDLHGGNFRATARVLGIAVNTLRAWLADRR